MKTLIIHPKDPTTEVLTGIYSGLTNKTVVHEGITSLDLRKLIETHQRIIMLGHGSPLGLLRVGQYPYTGRYIIDDSMAVELKEKTGNLYIWCHADQYVLRHGLSGLNCGMFISEVSEAFTYGYENVEWSTIESSNEIFVDIVSKYINDPLDDMYPKLLYEYGLLARTNPIARFNRERLYCTYTGINQNRRKAAV